MKKANTGGQASARKMPAQPVREEIALITLAEAIGRELCNEFENTVTNLAGLRGSYPTPPRLSEGGCRDTAACGSAGHIDEHILGGKKTMIHLLTYEYEGSPVPFTDDGYVNLTTLCAKFGKRPSKFLELHTTQKYIAAFAAETGLGLESDVMSENRTSLSDALLITVQGNFSDSREQGTWAHPDLALECARWLSPAFAIWCNRVVRAILSGQPYHPASDKPLHKSLERGIEQSRETLLYICRRTSRTCRRGIEQSRETLRRMHDAYWHALEVDGNVSIKCYLLAAGLDLSTKERMVLGARTAYRQRLAGDPVGKIRQRRLSRKQRSSPGNVHFGWQKVSTFRLEHLYAEVTGLGYAHEMPTEEALAAAHREYIPGMPKLGMSLYKEKSKALMQG